MGFDEGVDGEKYEYGKGSVSICNGGGGVASFMTRVFNFWVVLVFERQYWNYSQNFFDGFGQGSI